MYLVSLVVASPYPKIVEPLREPVFTCLFLHHLYFYTQRVLTIIMCLYCDTQQRELPDISVWPKQFSAVITAVILGEITDKTVSALLASYGHTAEI